MHPMLTIAVKAARQAGKIINRASLDVGQLRVSHKQQNDFVTEVDRAAEAAIIDILHSVYPGHAILAEESGHSGSAEAEYCWIIDPLDGTTNFIHGFPQYAVSIALQHRGALVQAVVYDPGRNELFTASKGAGAYLNDKRLRVAARKNINEALFATGVPFVGHGDHGTYLKELAAVIGTTPGVRRFGAASLDLAWVAAGRYDGFWESGLKPWDIAAGLLMVREAQGLVTDLDGGAGMLESGNVLAANEALHPQMLRLLKDAKKVG